MALHLCRLGVLGFIMFLLSCVSSYPNLETYFCEIRRNVMLVLSEKAIIPIPILV